MKVIRSILDMAQYFIFGAVLTIIVYFYILAPHRVDGRSMFPTYHNNDLVFVFKLSYTRKNPDRGDVVVFKYSPTQNYIKRVIAGPGETIMVSNGHYFINGTQLDESQYLSSSVITNGSTFLKEGVPYTLPEGEFLVSGDNRTGSTDGRDFGGITKDQIEGKVMLIWFPFTRFEVIKDPSYNI